MRKMDLLLVACFTLLVSSGCAVGMAASGTEPSDTSILFPGAPRAVVIAKLGPPETSTKNEDDCYCDSYFIVKGNAPSAGRAVAHAALDFCTLCLWEIVGTPMEMGMGREKHSRVLIVYDADEEIKDVQKINVNEKDEF